VIVQAAVEFPVFFSFLNPNTLANGKRVLQSTRGLHDHDPVRGRVLVLRAEGGGRGAPRLGGGIDTEPFQ
jgi:hypothetical protein